MRATRVQDLWDEISRVEGFNRHAKHPKYVVAAVINKDGGPDEKIVEVESIDWDHDRQILLLEIN